MWCRCPESGTSPRSRSAAGRARSGYGDISIRWMYMCSTPGCVRPAGDSSARSSTSWARAVCAPAAGEPVRRSHSSHGVRFISASAYSAATSGSCGNSW